MRYVALTRKTAEWLLTKSELIKQLAIDLAANRFAAVSHADFAEGPLRVSGSLDAGIIAMWNADWLGNTGHEPWGLIRLDGRYGLQSEPKRITDLFDQAVYVVSQRLQGLRIVREAHRHWPVEDVNTFHAFSGVTPELHMAYIEGEIQGEQAVLVVGPSQGYRALVDEAQAQKEELPALIAAVDALLSPTRPRPLMESGLPELRSLLASNRIFGEREMLAMVSTVLPPIERSRGDRTAMLGYADWVVEGSPLAPLQRGILTANVLAKHPLRIRGPAGSGKTLLMQLLAVKQLDDDRNARVLYVTHNSAMAQTVNERFEVLDPSNALRGDRLDVSTLADFGRKQLSLEGSAIIDIDAEETKKFQLDAVKDALKAELDVRAYEFEKTSLIRQAFDNDNFCNVFARLIVTEISVAIKGWGYQNDQRRYVQSERKLSRLHGIMDQKERDVVFSVFRRYYETIFENAHLLDSDDIAISLFGRLNTPLWELKRREEAYDYVFVDEAQLFNENERRVFHLLTRGNRGHAPIAIALDHAQDLMGQTSLGTFGLDSFDTETQNLRTSHRSTLAIMKLALFVIQQTTDLLSLDDYPDVTEQIENLIPDEHRWAKRPQFVNISDTETASDIVVRISKIRSGGIRRIAIVVLSDDYDQLSKALLNDPRATQLGIKELSRRGEARGGSDAPAVIVSRPSYIGGQEFDAVFVVGLEQGVVPPEVSGSDTLSYALKQQAYREIYVTFSRARYQLYVGIRRKMNINKVMQDAREAQLISYN